MSAPLFYLQIRKVIFGWITFKITHFEDLDIVYSVFRTTFSIHRTPLLNDTLDIGNGESSKRQVVSGVKNDDVASTLNGLRPQKVVRFRWRDWPRGRQHCGEIVYKDHGMFVSFIPVSTSPDISGTEITVWIVLGEFGGLGLFRLALPGSPVTMR